MGSNDRYRLGFRIPAQREQSTLGRDRGPAPESLRKTNPRDSGEGLVVYGDLARRRRCREMILARSFRT